MMNGNKAEMKTEEIIKAEMLRLVSNREINNNVSTIYVHIWRFGYAREKSSP